MASSGGVGTLPSPQASGVWCGGAPVRQRVDPGLVSPHCLPPLSSVALGSLLLSLVGKADSPLRIVTRAVSVLMFAHCASCCEHSAGWSS